MERPSVFSKNNNRAGKYLQDSKAISAKQGEEWLKYNQDENLTHNKS
jgi:hypothetical protein